MNTDSLIKKIQDKELNILKELMPIFERHGIRYALYWGSLIGAIRHNGFIPWDDDLDIIISRADYLKFRKIAKKELPDYLFLQDYTTDDEYPSYTAKVRDSRTTFIEKGYSDLKRMNHGIWIDIFILDYCDKSIISRIKCFEIRIIQRVILESVCSKHQIIKKSLSANINRFSLLSRIDRLSQSLDKNEKHEYYILLNKLLIETGKFKELVSADFEDTKVWIPKEYDYLLRSYYGDYMQLPPESQRVPSHLTNMISVDVPYTIYMRAQ